MRREHGKVGSKSTWRELSNQVYSGLQEQISHVNEQQKRRGLKRYIETVQDVEDIIRCYRRIETLFRQLQVSTGRIALRSERLRMLRTTQL
jgi:hypothetical protein